MIHISHNQNIKKILIENSISHHIDIVELHKELNNENKKMLFEITFIDIQSIPSLVIKELFKLKDRLTITTTQRNLWSYLSKFGLKNKCIDSFTNIKHKNTKEPIKAIAIGGSAGSLEKAMSIIESLPYVDISVFVVIHILPNEKSYLSNILQSITKYKVCEATSNMHVEKNTIYIAPPNNNLLVVDGFIYLDDKEKLNFARPSIDITFKSLVYEYTNSLLAILLCGYGKDGSSSLKELHENNSKIIIEDPKECEAKDMLLNAIQTKKYTKILQLKHINNYLNSLLSASVDIDDEIEHFLENIFIIYGYDFRYYDRKSLARRIELIMSNYSITNFKEFESLVLDDNNVFTKLLQAFSINVTTFFRNPEVFKQIRKYILPNIEDLSSIRVWCAGCSRGDEPYSIAIMLDEAGLLDKSQIYATDFNGTILNEAKNALFTKSELNEFAQNYIESNGKKKFENWFNIKDEYIEIKEHIREKVLFFKHNLVSDSSINEFHIIFCRNVLIYFDDKLQKTVFDTIYQSLYKNGYLVLGESEVIPKEHNYTALTNKKNKLFKKEVE
ncbi:hypothetical protein HUE87_03245 [Candidatus Sulfurimonas marisnigri]|uniref:Chemotaxis protein CheR n=1 Tax=Candidatus Sulfurimonas marisnigri TaxID=2740405 RepID=A0A7S7M1M0_9BACT|nr:CheR family methyltransferase [Candidatus Sulfurimonas marisnigri]QOY55265.1 hypothetical protein HUE87_03245 [Candidatus Sulfurimonas marisnigri]